MVVPNNEHTHTHTQKEINKLQTTRTRGRRCCSNDAIIFRDMMPLLNSIAAYVLDVVQQEANITAVWARGFPLIVCLQTGQTRFSITPWLHTFLQNLPINLVLAHRRKEETLRYTVYGQNQNIRTITPQQERALKIKKKTVRFSQASKSTQLHNIIVHGTGSIQKARCIENKSKRAARAEAKTHL